jgi:hypothetical protein
MYFPGVISSDEELPLRAAVHAVVSIVLADSEANAFFAPGQRFTIWADAVASQTISAQGLVGQGVICHPGSLLPPGANGDRADGRAVARPLGGLCGLIYASLGQRHMRVWAAMVAAVRVSRPQKVVGAVAGQFHLVGDLAEGGFDPVAPLGDDRPQDRRHGVALALGGREEDGGAAGCLAGRERRAGESLVQQQVTRRRRGGQQVIGHVALVDGRGHDTPGPDDPAAQVCPDGQPEAVEPFGVRGVAAEPGGQVVTRAGPAVRAADPGGVLDRQR